MVQVLVALVVVVVMGVVLLLVMLLVSPSASITSRTDGFWLLVRCAGRVMVPCAASATLSMKRGHTVLHQKNKIGANEKTAKDSGRGGR
jgi:hypothetical protein